MFPPTRRPVPLFPHAARVNLLVDQPPQDINVRKMLPNPT